MTIPTRELALQVYRELIPEIAAEPAAPVAALPSLEAILREVGPLPVEALFLGLAEDGLPVLLNLFDPAPGPLLIVADPGAGKTALLQTIAGAVALEHDPHEVQFGIVTAHPEEWDGYASLPQAIGVYPAYHRSSDEFLQMLVSWTHSGQSDRKAAVLLMDDLESMEQAGQETRSNLRYLLAQGPARGVWPLATASSRRMAPVYPWLEAFHTRIFGHMEDDRLAGEWSNLKGVTFSGLRGGIDFALREGRQWVKFWLPN
jgi:hypothetical protein